jgi:thiol-disulfide isomerase/thioredoxin
MEISSINQFNNFVIKNNKSLIVVLFYRTGCGPCENFKPQFVNLSNNNNYNNIEFIKIDLNNYGLTKIAEQFSTLNSNELIVKNCSGVQNLGIEVVPSVRFIKGECILNNGFSGGDCLNDIINYVTHFK